ncbi:hypothetical protein [Pseudomonas sp. ANT_H12B]|uniref:hypothetical protein n=1 Tax=Pseudomonas sp. ANT_H12B TaxID=2597348 RepID=UPI0011EC48AB|nr:hypothetical protein [Pseudomonas sp. ANT_H12B]KAA0975392.1 hypothetical protein FQ185_07700 [Pseudomonas sp. ANT_H12B]
MSNRSKATRAKADCMPENFPKMAKRRYRRLSADALQDDPAKALRWPGRDDFRRAKNTHHAIPNKALIWIKEGKK